MIRIYLSIAISLLAAAFISVIHAQTPWQQTDAAGVLFEYRVTQDGLNLEGKLTANTTGWVAVGFNPTSVMRNANIIIAYVSGGNTLIRDDWGTSNTAHVSDISLGGTSDVTLTGGSETAGQTSVEFTLPLQTADQYDRPLQIGSTYTVILARGANGADSFTGMHADAGYGSITLLQPVASDDEVIAAAQAHILSVYPNPFNPRATIRYYLADKSPAELRIYNARGQLVHTRALPPEAGENSYLWQAQDLPSGSYTVRLLAGGRVTQSRVSLLK